MSAIRCSALRNRAAPQPRPDRDPRRACLAAMHSSPRLDPGTGGTAVARGRVLLVEDDPEAAEFFRHTLTVRGRFQVTHTPDPAAALALAAGAPWDLIITDLNLPGMSGLDLL